MALTYNEYRDAAAFLDAARVTLERDECANSLMLGICLRLVDEPAAWGSQPYLAAVTSAGTLAAAAVMTPPHRLQLWAEQEHDRAPLETLADALEQGQWPVPGVLARQATAETFASIWAARTGAGYSVAQWMRLYELRRVLHPDYPPGAMRPPEASEMDLVRHWARGFHDECFDDGRSEQTVRSAEQKAAAGQLYLWVDGVARSMAAQVRPTGHGAAVSLVYTPPGERRKGYATALVAQVSQHILDEGKLFCTLFAALNNPTSNSIYQKIGFRAVADVVTLDFGERTR
jgi:hypothetical protein